MVGVAAGPVSIALDDMGMLWFPYKGGIMTGCCDTTATHAVLIVGFGEANGRASARSSLALALRMSHP